MIRDEVTPYEFKIILLVAKGWSNKRIGDELNRQENTIKSRISDILYKTGYTTRLELSVGLAWEEGWYGTGSRFTDGLVFGPYVEKKQFQFQ